MILMEYQTDQGGQIPTHATGTERLVVDSL